MRSHRIPQVTVVVLFCTLGVSCSKPAPELSAEATTKPPKVAAAASSTAMEERKPAEIRPTVGTGVKEKMLLASLNSNVGLAPKFHHGFFYVMTTKPPESARIYGDKHSEMKLMLTGPSDDLELITLMISTKEFFNEDKPEAMRAEGAAGFGRCVQRMGLAVDPSWGEDLYNWMNKNMSLGLLDPDGITTSHRNLLAKFSGVRSGGKTIGVQMMIGTPSKE